MTNAYFAKGTAQAVAPEGAAARYGTARSNVCVFADADGRPMEGWEATQEGPLVRVIPLPAADLRRLWAAFQCRPTLPPRPDRQWPMVSEPPHFLRHATREEAEVLAPGLIAEIEAFTDALKVETEWRKRATKGDEVYELVLGAFAGGLRPLGKTQTDLVFGVRG